jgi:hypothetical protein
MQYTNALYARHKLLINVAIVTGLVGLGFIYQNLTTPRPK